MEDERKTKKQLIDELKKLRKRIPELEKSEAERKQVKEKIKSERDKLQALIDGLAYTGVGVDIVGSDYKVISGSNGTGQPCIVIPDCCSS